MKQNIKYVIVGGSAGSFQLIVNLLSELRPKFDFALILCLHRLKQVPSGFAETLNLRSNINVIEPCDKDQIKGGKIYLAPANYHLLAEVGNTFSLSVDDAYNYSRPSIDLTFDSFSFVHREKILAIIVSGANADGAKGMLKVKERGGYTIVQDPAEATVKTMVNSTLALLKPDKILTIDGIIAFLNSL